MSISRPRTILPSVHPALSLKEAREACAAAKKQRGRGIDPSEQKKMIARAGENPFEAIMQEWSKNKTSAWSERYAEDALERIAAISSRISATAPSTKLPRRSF